MPVVTQAQVATTEVCVLGEGPFWDSPRAQLLWVDIREGIVFAGFLEPDGSITVIDRVHLEGQTVGAVAASPSGSWLIAGTERLIVRQASGRLTVGPRIISGDAGRRLNDGKPDPAGDFVVGTVSLIGDSTAESLVRVDKGGAVHPIDLDLTLSNGLAWTADGRTMYSIDTLRQTVYRREYDPSSGRVGKREEAFLVDHGVPDGMCLDAEEHLWIAMWGIGEVHRYSPTGDLEQVIVVPAPHTSSIAFAGPQLETLVITTATQDLDVDQLEKYPLSGRLFTVQPGVLGLPQSPWNGSIFRPHDC